MEYGHARMISALAKVAACVRVGVSAAIVFAARSHSNIPNIYVYIKYHSMKAQKKSQVPFAACTCSWRGNSADF